MYVIILSDSTYACALGLKPNIFNAFKFETKKEAAKFARGKYTNYIIKEI